MLIAAFCERIPHFYFFRRLTLPLAEIGHEMLFLSNRLSVVLLARRSGYRALLIRGNCPSYTPFFSFSDCDSARAALSSSEANRCMYQLETFYALNLKPLGVSAYFFWNGSSLLASALTSLVRQDGCQTLYFEIGNFPGKLLVDPEGVNAKSWFARNYCHLDMQGFDVAAFELWRKDYLEKKLSQHKVEQARLSTKFNWFYPLDVFGFYSLSAPYSEPPAVWARTRSYLRSQRVRYDYDSFSPSDNQGYIFFPLQVSTDSQLVVNSDVDNFEALRKALDIAQSAGVRLVVKPHPAEGDRVFVKKLSAARHKLGFLFVEGNTFQLMQYSSHVVTINSTAGMEAMLLGKIVTVLGRAMYKLFTLEDLGYYLMQYLFDIDYFSNETIMKENALKIIERLQVGSVGFK